MAVRRRVLKYKPAVNIGRKIDARELAMRLLKEKPRPERERFFAVLVSEVRKAKAPINEKEEIIKEFVKMRKEIEDEERGKTTKPSLSGETEEVERHVVRPVPKQNREFLRENVSDKLRKWKKEREVVNKHK